MSKFGLPRSCRLHSRKSIEQLFTKGVPSFSYPVKMVYAACEFDDNEPIKAAFSVSKRNFKHAVDRNRYKRLLREAYRLNCHELKEKLHHQGTQLSVMFIYANKEHNDYATVEKGMQRLLKRLLDSIEKNE
ncbi:MAG: ribonuclease P protein component [Mangrovibacterium sp.]